MENNKFQELSNKINKLVNDFQEAKKKYHNIYLSIRVVTILFSCASTIFISLTFIEEYETLFKILSVIASGIAGAVISTNKIVDYRGKSIQRTRTLVRLLKLKRAVKFQLNVEADLKIKDEMYYELVTELDQILLDDYTNWEDTTENVE